MPSRFFRELMHQHDQLRVIMNRCEELADDVDDGMVSPDALTCEVARLRVVLAAHNHHELVAFADARVDPTAADHVAEHGRIDRGFSAGPTAQLRDAIAALRLHLAGEERCLATSRVLCEELGSVEGPD